MVKSGYKKAFDSIVNNRERVLSGKVNSIPFGFDRFEQYVPGIMQEVMVLITAASGIGKSQITKHLFLHAPINFIKNNPESNLKLKIFYFALEESEEEFYINLIANKLKIDHGLDIDSNDLLSRRKSTISEDVLKKILETEEHFKEFRQWVEVIDSVSNPFGIFKHVREYARNNGRFYLHGNEVDPARKVEDSLPSFDKYVPNNSDEYVIVIVDHIGLFSYSEKDTLHAAMSKWSQDYCRKQLSKHYKYICVNVQQQMGDQEKQQFTFRGDNIVNKVKPSLNGLADNKLTQRDHHIVLGLFAPDRYGIEDYEGYNINLLKSKFISMQILKNRIGIPNKEVPLCFYGDTNIFKELPYPDDMNYDIYKQIENKQF